MLYRLQARADRCRPEMLLLIGIGMVPTPRGRDRGALYVGAVAGARLRGVCGAVQQVRRAGELCRVLHRAGDGAEILEHVGERTTAPVIAPGRCLRILSKCNL